MLDKDTLAMLRTALESKESFQPLLEFFVYQSVQEIKAKEMQPGIQNNYSNFYANFIDNYSKINTDLIFENCQSPIERMFISSLLLVFIKNGILGFTITPLLPNVEDGMETYRINHNNMLKIVESYRKQSGDFRLENFEAAFKEMYNGKYTNDDYKEICHHYFIVKNFTYNSFFVTLQPYFPHLKINNKSIRPDILFWCPGNDKIKLIVECDGFAYHNSKQSFINDRKRDRLLKVNGYDVIRYSGSEIYSDPAGVSEDIYKFIKKMI